MYILKSVTYETWLVHYNNKQGVGTGSRDTLCMHDSVSKYCVTGIMRLSVFGPSNFTCQMPRG